MGQFKKYLIESVTLNYRMSAFDLSKAGETMKNEGKSRAQVKDACKEAGLDKEQTSIVMGGYLTESNQIFEADDRRNTKETNPWDLYYDKSGFESATNDLNDTWSKVKNQPDPHHAEDEMVKILTKYRSIGGLDTESMSILHRNLQSTYGSKYKRSDYHGKDDRGQYIRGDKDDLNESVSDVIAAVRRLGDHIGYKETNWEYVPKIKKEDLERRVGADVFTVLPTFTAKDLWGYSDSSPMNDFKFDLYKDKDIVVFILNRDGEQYLVNTEGAKYCRYIVKIV